MHSHKFCSHKTLPYFALGSEIEYSPAAECPRCLLVLHFLAVSSACVILVQAYLPNLVNCLLHLQEFCLCHLPFLLNYKSQIAATNVLKPAWTYRVFSTFSFTLNVNLNCTLNPTMRCDQTYSYNALYFLKDRTKRPTLSSL